MAPRQTKTQTAGVDNNYGSITIHDIEESTPLVTNRTVLRNDKTKPQRRVVVLLVLILTVVLCCCIIVVQAPSYSKVSYFQEEDIDEDDVFAQSPVSMGFVETIRQVDASPSEIWGNNSRPLPTNSWYLNLLSHRAASHPDDACAAYTIPYSIDTAPPTNMVGIRVHWPVLQASSTNLQMVDDFKNALCVGTSTTSTTTTEKPKTNGYTVMKDAPLSNLGVGLEWKLRSNATMTTHVVRGMPFATMRYTGAAPVLYSYNGLARNEVVVDQEKTITDACSIGGGSNKNATNATFNVQGNLKLHFINSDFTWLVFFSDPVSVHCHMSDGDEKTRDFSLHVVQKQQEDAVLTVKVALLNQCTTGKSDIQQHCLESRRFADLEGYEAMLMENSFMTPASPSIRFDAGNNSTQEATIIMDWNNSHDAVEDDNSNDAAKDDKAGGLLVFALPHHQRQLVHQRDAVTKHCIPTFHGRTCLVKASSWRLSVPLGPPIQFTAARPPHADVIPALNKALAKDIQFRLSSNLQRAAADTYFSGKILARLGRVIVIASEIRRLATLPPEELEKEYRDTEWLAASVKVAQAEENIVSDRDIQGAVNRLKEGVEVWLSTKAEAPFIYDGSWGGLVNCGCRYVGKGELGVCNNTYPDCPALVDVNEDFGNGYYNDHHYHLGYHLYAAAVAAQFDPVWARKNFRHLMLYVRDFANPSIKDAFFPPYRQKDWYLGSSWASGVVSAENSPHGRNEESSSEAVAAYEAVSLFGSAMAAAFADTDAKSRDTATSVHRFGQLLTATEIHATNRYWHVWSSDTHTNSYPSAYSEPVVGMLYDTQASFQTWFAPQAVVSYGIQLIPLTPIAEERDDPEWAQILLPRYEQSCLDAGDFCIKNGWSILQAGLTATAGNRTSAVQQALAVPDQVFATEGGVGNSLSNTLWFVATRKPVE